MLYELCYECSVWWQRKRRHRASACHLRPTSVRWRHGDFHIGQVQTGGGHRSAIEEGTQVISPELVDALAAKQNPMSTLISPFLVTLSSRVPDPTVDRLVSTNSGAAWVDATILCLDWCVSTEHEVNRCFDMSCDMQD